MNSMHVIANQWNLRIVVRDSMLTSSIFDLLALAYWQIDGRAENDVFLCSYPKSGRTWLRFLLTYYQLKLIGSEHRLTLKNLPALSPNLTLFTSVRLRKLPSDLQIYRLLGTHSEFPNFFRGKRVITLKRNLCDTLISYYHHLYARNEYNGDLESFLWSWQGLPRLIRYCNRWTNACKKNSFDAIFQIGYEQLNKDTYGSVIACLEFMNIDIDVALVNEAIEYASASNMRELEARWGNPNFSAAQLQANKMGFKVRRAQVGGFREALSDATLRKIEQRLGADLVGFNGINEEY